MLKSTVFTSLVVWIRRCCWFVFGKALFFLLMHMRGPLVDRGRVSETRQRCLKKEKDSSGFSEFFGLLNCGAQIVPWVKCLVDFFFVKFGADEFVLEQDLFELFFLNCAFNRQLS